MDSLPEPKPLFWVGSSKRDLKALPRDVQRAFGTALLEAQFGGRPIHAKVLKGFGSASTLELVEDYQGSAFRAIYTVRFAKAIFVLHVFEKKSRRGIKTPKQEIDLIHRRLKLAEAYYEKWSAKQPNEDEQSR